MIIKNLIDEDIINYKKPSMFLIFPRCSFKCCWESGKDVCQNSDVAKSPDIEVSVESVVKRYTENDITKAIVCGGLEPFDSWDDLFDLLLELRLGAKCDDDVVLYTGYNENELEVQVELLKKHFKNIIIKYGRFIPDRPQKYDEILGVNLASDNQYAKKIC